MATAGRRAGTDAPGRPERMWRTARTAVFWCARNGALAPGEKTDGRAVASLGPAGASAPFAASPPLREAVMVAGRTGCVGNRARSARSPIPVSCSPGIATLGAGGRFHRIEAGADGDPASVGFPAISGPAEIGAGWVNRGAGVDSARTSSMARASPPRSTPTCSTTGETGYLIRSCSHAPNGN